MIYNFGDAFGHERSAQLAAQIGGPLEAFTGLFASDGVALFQQRKRHLSQEINLTFRRHTEHPQVTCLVTLLQQVGDDVPDQSIVQELQKGYKIGERVLRASMVKVARNTVKN